MKKHRLALGYHIGGVEQMVFNSAIVYGGEENPFPYLHQTV